MKADAKTTLIEVRDFIGWGALAILLIASCVAFNLLTTSVLIWGVWSVLQLVFG